MFGTTAQSQNSDTDAKPPYLKPRVITFAPHLAELVYAAGAGDSLVGVSEYTPKVFQRNLPIIGNAFAFDWAAIAKLKPDLILVWGSGNSPATQARLKALGLSTFVSEPKTLSDIVNETRALAQQLGRASDATSIAQLSDTLIELNRLKTQRANKPVITVFHPIWPKPLMTINREHVINDALNYCGAGNVFAQTAGLTPTVTSAQVLRAKPAVLLLTKKDTETTTQAMQTWQTLLDVFPKAHRPRVVWVSGDRFHQPGPGLIPETLKLCNALQAND